MRSAPSGAPRRQVAVLAERYPSLRVDALPPSRDSLIASLSGNPTGPRIGSPSSPLKWCAAAAWSIEQEKRPPPQSATPFWPLG